MSKETAPYDVSINNPSGDTDMVAAPDYDTFVSSHAEQVTFESFGGVSTTCNYTLPSTKREDGDFEYDD